MCIEDKLKSWLEAGRNRMGEISIGEKAGVYSLTHWLDSTSKDLVVWRIPDSAIELGKYDLAGNYRPLRSAPTLKRGWKLELPTLGEVVLALDFFYPAMLGTLSAFEKNQASPTPLRETLNRQTGMYRVTQKINDSDATEVVTKVCADQNCLKKISWTIQPDDFPNPPLATDANTIPLICEEACAILVGSIRDFVKKSAT